MIYFDMDGVLAKYDFNAYNFSDPNGPLFLTGGYFRNRPPDLIALGLFKMCIQMFPYDTFVITSIPDIKKKNNIVMDKLYWLIMRVPEFNIGTQFIGPVDRKMNFIEWIRGSSIDKRDILIDDYNKNLYGWMSRGGTAIKYINGLNSIQSWVGDYLDGTMFKSEDLFKILTNIIKEI